DDAEQHERLLHEEQVSDQADVPCSLTVGTARIEDNFLLASTSNEVIHENFIKLDAVIAVEETVIYGRTEAMQECISHNLVIFINVTKLGQSNQNTIEEFHNQFLFTLNHTFNGFTSKGTIHTHAITAAEGITEIRPTYICTTLSVIPVLSRTNTCWANISNT